MFENYLASSQDLSSIEAGIAVARKKELNFIFKNKEFLKKTIIASYDSRYLYLWSTKKLSIPFISTNLKEYVLYKIAHKATITDEEQSGWCANLPGKFYPILATINKENDLGFISGGLLTPFIKLQQKRNIKNNPFYTQESYLATITHELAHIYYNSQPLSIQNNNANLEYLQTSINFYRNKNINKTPKLNIYRSYAFEAFTELFAFCTEYYTTSLFWPKYKNNLDKFLISYLTRIKKLSPILSSRDPHTFAFVLGKILVSRSPKTWPIIILKS